MKQRIISLLLVSLLLAALLTGCASPAEKTTEAPATEAVPAETAQPTQAPAPESAATESPVTEAQQTEGNDMRAAAMECIGSSVETLYETIGEPEDSSYASSCTGPGEDGELYYDGFTVYTYRENGTETVTDVW